MQIPARLLGDNPHSESAPQGWRLCHHTGAPHSGERRLRPEERDFGPWAELRHWPASAKSPYLLVVRSFLSCLEQEHRWSLALATLPTTKREPNWEDKLVAGYMRDGVSTARPLKRKQNKNNSNCVVSLGWERKAVSMEYNFRIPPYQPDVPE